MSDTTTPSTLRRRAPSPSPSHPPAARRIGAALAAALAASSVLLTGCGSSGTHPGQTAPVVIDGSGAPTGFAGDQLSRPVTLSRADESATFRSTTGKSTSLAALQSGRLMLLYFGYTHCPDVCPTTMADLGQALKGLPVQLSAHTQVVFITSDPARDTAPVMKAWLANFDAGLPLPFIGLTASIGQIDKTATSVGVPLSPPVKQPNGTITVQHGAQTLAFLNGRSSLLWLAGTTPADYARDITRLLDRDASS